MNKELLISIKPEHLLNILNGKKTRELRTRVPKGYIGWVYIYCTKVGKGLFSESGNTYFLFGKGKSSISLNGKVVARFWFDEYEEIDFSNIKRLQEIKQQSCIDDIQFIFDYAKGKNLYAWHIKELEIFDTPKELSEFYKGNRYPNGEIITPNICEFSPFDYDSDLENCLDSFRLNKAPQSYQFVYVKE